MSNVMHTYTHRHWLFVCPHLFYPSMIGSDILIEKLAVHFSKQQVEVDVLGTNQVLYFRSGELAKIEQFSNSHRSKYMAFARSLLLKSHYSKEKFNTASFEQAFLNRVVLKKYTHILYSYVSSYEYEKSLEYETESYIVSHNDEYKWFDNVIKKTSSPLVMLVALFSKKYVKRFINKIKNKVVFLHVSLADCQGYQYVNGPHRYQLVPIGVDPVVNGKCEDAQVDSDCVSLVFVGSLGVDMNFDALKNFSETYLPALKKKYGDQLRITLLGSSPSRRVYALASRYGWELHANVSEHELNQRLCRADFSIMPFTYTAGVKLKMFKSLSCGLPFLSSQTLNDSAVERPPFCLFSDRPDEWITHIDQVKSISSKAIIREAIAKHMEPYTWEQVGAQLHQTLMDRNFNT
jgi:glycosyltransferase involved in cell wall biosynthesis